MSSSASVSTLVINSSHSSSYRSIYASGYHRIDGASLTDALITFGTSENAGGFDYAPPAQQNGSGFELGESDASYSGTLTLAAPRHLAMRIAPVNGELTGLNSVVVNGLISGSGSVSLSRISNGGTDQVKFNFGAGEANRVSTFSGGIFVNAHVEMYTNEQSCPSNGTIVTSGPLGVGTVNLNGGTWVIGGRSGSSDPPTFVCQ